MLLIQPKIEFFQTQINFSTKKMSDRRLEFAAEQAFRTEGAEENFIVNPLGIDKNATYEICENDEKKIVKSEEILEFVLSIFVDYVYKVKTIVINKL